MGEKKNKQIRRMKKKPTRWQMSERMIRRKKSRTEGFWGLVCNLSDFYCRFCPSVFFYLASVVPAIWFLELHAMEERIETKANQEIFNQTAQHQNTSVEDLKIIIEELGVRLSARSP